MKQFITVWLTMLGMAAASAQSGGVIRMNVADSAAAVRMTSLSADVQVMGNIATTTLDMVFENGSARVLEGELEFPLAEGESVTGYALDIGGRMRQGVVVDKDKGRQVFEAVVRQGVDPGLIEQTAGNSFRTRVYPLPARGSRRVQVTYQSEIRTFDGSRTYTYAALPEGTLDSFDFRITVLQARGAPQAVSGQELLGGALGFDKMSSGYTASLSRKDFRLSSELRIKLPQEAPSGSATVFTESIGKDTFFYYYAPLSLPAKAKALPRRLTVWYDISGSAERRMIDEEMALLEAYIAALDAPEITLVPFCNELYSAAVFTGSASEIARGVRDYVRAEGFDGATNLGYDFAGMFGGDEVLLFTDGLGNWDDGAAANREGGSPKGRTTVVHTISSSAAADHAWLRQTASRNGGVYVNLRAMTKEQALAHLMESPPRLIRAEYDRSALSEVYPQDNTAAGEDFAITGRLIRKEATVTLHFGYGSTEEHTVTFTVSAYDGVQAEHVARQWAVMKIDALSADYEANKGEITETARRFGIVTRDTSLIVLDTVQDYVRYGIVPPQELRAEYDRIVSRQGAGAKAADKGKGLSALVLQRFEDFRRWWSTSPAEFKKMRQPKKGEGGTVRPLNDTAAVERAYIEESAVQMDSMAEAPMGAARLESRAAAPRFEAQSPRIEAQAAAKTEADGNGKSGSQASIQLQAWSPNAEYLSVLKRARRSEMFARYMELKAQYAASPAFYMEVSDYFAEEGMQSESLRILSNLAELELENTDILRALGNKLVERGLYPLAVPVFEKLVALRPEIPQFLRDLGMAYFYAGDAQKAVDTLYSVAYKQWDSRFEEVQQIALNDMNAIIANPQKGKVDTSAVDKKVIQNFDLDLRIVLTWNTDNCDVDLWVTDKDGEKCYYGNKLTANGGRMSRDFTQGYGPEEFCIRTSPGGSFKIEANYFGNHQQKLLQPVTVQAEVYTNFGRPNQRREVLTLQLDSVKQTFLIGHAE